MTRQDLPGGPFDPAPRWRQSPHDASGVARGAGGLHRLLGGAPLAVVLRLTLLSLVVGAALVWLDLRPIDVLEAALRTARQLWALGFDGLREFGTYILAGAVIVVPVWIVLRLLAIRPAR